MHRLLKHLQLHTRTLKSKQHAKRHLARGPHPCHNSPDKPGVFIQLQGAVADGTPAVQAATPVPDCTVAAAPDGLMQATQQGRGTEDKHKYRRAGSSGWACSNGPQRLPQHSPSAAHPFNQSARITHRHCPPQCRLQLLWLHVACLWRPAEVERDVVRHALNSIL